MTNNQPIYHGTRKFLGLRDLVVSLYTKKCQFKCSYCTLPTRSSESVVSGQSIMAQIDWVWEKYQDKLFKFQQLSIGNEGSILDTHRFPPEAMNHLLTFVKKMSSLKVLSLETRPEYISENTLENVLNQTSIQTLDVTVGLETQDDHLRQKVLNKQITKKIFEKKLKILGNLGVRLTSYVLVKPGPTMTDEEGVAEAVATIDYLAEQCQQVGIDLVIYLTPTYISKGSLLEKQAQLVGYTPPRIQDIFRIVQVAQTSGLPVYTGLWSEGLAEKGNDFTRHKDYDPTIRKAIFQFNTNQDPSVLETVAPGLERSILSINYEQVFL